jgi:hypothetical protein
VLIGIDMDQHAISASLDRCLLTDQEMALGVVAWRGLVDPFPAWFRVQEQNGQAAREEHADA